MALRSFGMTMAIVAAALAAAAATALLPENPYQRYQLLDGTIHERARWIYERVHYDPTPIDVAFVGPSRIGAGVNAPLIGQNLAARGLPSNVVNFSLPETGRNLNLVFVDELLQAKTPKLIVIGVIEKPSRYGHSAYKYVAPREFLANPAYFGNLNYLSDLAYLPFRQMELFAANIAPDAAGLTKTFDPTKYRGHSIDTTGSIVLPDGSLKEGRAAAPLLELDRGVRKLEAGMTPPLLPPSLADIEFGDERYYIRRIVELARARGVRIAFLFLPYYTGPSTAQEQRFYEQYGPLWNAGFLSRHAALYSDYGHLTSDGAIVLSNWVTDPVASMLTSRKEPK